MSNFQLFHVDVEHDSDLVIRHTVSIDTGSFEKNEFEQMEELAASLGGNLYCYAPVEGLGDIKAEVLTPEDAGCPILALAPAEYTYWEKRVWRRGVRDLEMSREVAQAVRGSQDGKTVGVKS